MPRTTSLAREPVNKAKDYFASTLTLACWRLRQTGWLLFVACLGFVAAMIIACVVPLFTTAATASGLQAILQADPARSDITLNVNTQGLSSDVVRAVQQQVTPLVQQKLASYQEGTATMAIQESSIQALSPTALQHIGSFSIYATALEDLKPNLRLLAGRWPASDANVLEIVLTPTTARALHLSINDRITLQGDFSTANQTGGPIDPRTAFNAQLVGLFDVGSPAPVSLHGQSFNPALEGVTNVYTLLTSTPAFLLTVNQMAARLHSAALFSYLMFQLTWDYRLRTRNIQADQVSDLTNRLFITQTDVGNYESTQQQLQFGTVGFPYITQAALYSPTPGSFELLDLLEQYTNRVTLVGIPITILAVQIVALLLFFVSMLIGVLLDRQMTSNALLSSRGASSKQIFWSLFLQGLALCLVGVGIGPPAAMAIVATLVSHALPTDGVRVAQNALGQPLQVLSSIGPAAGATLLAALLTLGLVVRYTSGLNVLTLRHETARATRPPFWQRYYLDVLAAVIALSGYGVSLYLADIAHEVDITTQDLILTPLTLLAPIFLLLGCLLLFLRILPWLLRFGGWAAQRRRGAITMLALVQMARAPRQIMRMTLLLSLTVAFAIFAQVFSASQTRRIDDISAYESGADFSGDIGNTITVQNLTMDQVIARYSKIPGVISVSADYTDQGTTVGNGGEQVLIQFRAVDLRSFPQTVIWTSQDSNQPLSNLLDRLPRPKQMNLPNGTRGWVVPAIVDQALATQLQLHTGDTFSSSLNNLTQATLNYQIAAIIAHIPTVNSSLVTSASESPGGMLVDYQTFSNIYLQTFKQQIQGAKQDSALKLQVPVNHIWLRTANDASSLTSVRTALATSRFATNNLYDRRDITAELQGDPFNLNILIILSIGGLMAFLLAFIGNLISSWLSVRSRRGSFVVLRALGATSRQIAGVLLWEQGIVYAGAIALGLAFGAVLASVAVPVLVFTDLPQHGPMSSLSISDLYLLQHALPARIVVPFSLDLIFVVLVVICLLALVIMIRAALHPSISNELRLSED